MLGAALALLLRKNYWQGAVSLVAFAVCTFLSFGVALLTGLTPSRSNNKANLNMPKNYLTDFPTWIEYDTIKTITVKSEPNRNDKFVSRIYRDYLDEKSTDSILHANISYLSEINNGSREKLFKYLAANPTWRISLNKNGKHYAHRRFLVNNIWLIEDEIDFESNKELGCNSDDNVRFSTKIAIGLDGQVTSQGSNYHSYFNNGDRKPFHTKRHNRDWTSSSLVIIGQNVTLHITEKSKSIYRDITKSSIGFLSDEFFNLATNLSLNELPVIVEESENVRSNELMEIFSTKNTGFYQSSLYINPGAKGYVYLVAYDLSDEKELSKGHLSVETKEMIGWSKNTRDLFYANSNFYISRPLPFGARIEVWFQPYDSQNSSKIYENNYWFPEN
jgi:hypothetical protein